MSDASSGQWASASKLNRDICRAIALTFQNIIRELENLRPRTKRVLKVSELEVTL